MEEADAIIFPILKDIGWYVAYRVIISSITLLY